MYFQHWKPQAHSVHLVAGGAFAAGLETARRAYYEDGLSSELAVARGLAALVRKYGLFECPADSGKSLHRTAGALEFYFDRYALGHDPAVPIAVGGKRGIEFTFAQPLSIRHPELEEPLVYTGRSDMIVNYADGVYIEDDKTTSQLGASWAKQWDMRSQFTGYVWAAREAGLAVNGVLVRGVSILKTKYDTAEAITPRAPFEIDRWLAQTERDVKRMIECWESGMWDYNLDHACAEYGGCPLVLVCKSPQPDKWLPMYFEPRVWDPLIHEEVELPVWNAAIEKDIQAREGVTSEA